MHVLKMYCKLFRIFFVSFLNHFQNDAIKVVSTPYIRLDDLIKWQPLTTGVYMAFEMNKEDLILCCNMHRKIIFEELDRTGGPVSLGDCVNCSKPEFLQKKRPTKRQAVPPLRPKLSGGAGRDPLRVKPSLSLMDVEVTRGVSAFPLLWSDYQSWDHKNVYTPKIEAITWETEYLCSFIADGT